MTTEKEKDIVIPSSPADLADIFKVMKQISDSKTRAKGETDYQKEALKALSEKYDIDVKHLRQMANDYHKDTFEERADQFDTYQALYEAVVVKGAQVAKNTPTAVSDDEEE